MIFLSVKTNKAIGLMYVDVLYRFLHIGFSMTGCKNCANVAPDVFKIEEDFGRARVYKQCGERNSDRVQQAVDSWYVLSLNPTN